MALLQTKNLNYFYQDGDQRRFILKNTDCEFQQGTFYAILGPSGSGKTTFLAMISALDSPSSGEVLYNQKDIAKIGHDTYRRNDVSIIFQQYNLIPYLTAIENVLVAMDITDNPLPKEPSTIAYNLLDYIGITKEKANRLVTKLSGGEQQRVAIARALSTNVNLILADEPTGNLDEGKEQEIIEIFKELAHLYNKAVIVVTHSQEIAKQADVIFQLRNGTLTKN